MCHKLLRAKKMFAELQKQELTLSLLTNGIKTQNKFDTIKTELNLVPENKTKHRSIYWLHSRPVHEGANHVPKVVSDHDPLADWVHDLNYMRSQALQQPSRAQTGSAHRVNILLHNCKWITSRLAFLSSLLVHTYVHESRSERALRSQVPRIRISRRIMIQNAPFYRVSKAWFERVLHSQL